MHKEIVHARRPLYLRFLLSIIANLRISMIRLNDPILCERSNKFLILERLVTMRRLPHRKTVCSLAPYWFIDGHEIKDKKQQIRRVSWISRESVEIKGRLSDLSDKHNEATCNEPKSWTRSGSSERNKADE